MMINKVTETTFQCDSCLEVKDNSQYQPIFIDDVQGDVCSCCYDEIMQELKNDDCDDSDDCDDYDPSDDIYDRWKDNQMMMD